MDSDPEKRQLGLDTMAKVYGWPDIADGIGDFWGYTADHLFAEIWTREGLSFRDRRLLLIGLLVGRGLHDVLDIQLQAALDKWLRLKLQLGRPRTPCKGSVA